MKRLVLTILILGWGIGLRAQCPLHEAVDFTVNDCHGTEIHLFDILDSGQYVLIDFFFTTCSGCHQIAPTFSEAYQAFGCNRNDVVFLEIDDGDSEQACLNWIDQHDIAFPTISGEAGGTNICNQYLIQSFPTVILIAPDHSIVIRDLWPPDDLQFVITSLEEKGVEQHACSDDLMENGSEISLFPNPANESITLKGLEPGTVSVFNVLGQKMEESTTEGPELTIHTSHYLSGVYFIKSGTTTLRLIITH